MKNIESPTETNQILKYKRVKCANIYPKGVTSPQKSDSWNLLNSSILSEEGKRIVSEDPDLGKKTVQKLLALGKDESEGAYLYLEEEECGEKLSSIGLAVISICIKANQYATWAEFAARVAVTYRFPFLATVLALQEYMKRHGYFTMYKNGTQVPMQWLPRKAHVDNSDFSRHTDIGEDWKDIA